MLLQRTITALVLASIVLLSLLQQSSILFITILYLVISFSLYELFKLLKTNPINKILISAIMLFLSFPVFLGIQLNYFIFFIVVAIWWAINLFFVINYPTIKPKFSGIFELLNILFLLIPVFGLFEIYVENKAWLILLLFIVWGADIFAYFAGKAFGKNKLAPKLSSGKTIEGICGGLLGVIIVTIVWLWINNIELSNYLSYLFIAIITGSFSVVGDLYQSIYKREAGVKDSGNIFPGHGGILDRIDGLLAAIPIFILSTAFIL